jgi:hypothetical protein
MLQSLWIFTLLTVCSCTKQPLLATSILQSVTAVSYARPTMACTLTLGPGFPPIHEQQVSECAWTASRKQGCREQVRAPVKKNFPLPPTRTDRIKIFTLNRRDWYLSCRVTWAWAATTGPPSGPSGPSNFYRISHSLIGAARKLCPQFVIYELRTREWVGLHNIISDERDYFKIFTTVVAN